MQEQYSCYTSPTNSDDDVIEISTSSSTCDTSAEIQCENNNNNNNNRELLTLTTTVVLTVSNPPEVNDTRDFENDYRTSPITFDDYFYKSTVQRAFILKLVRFQILLNFSAALASLFCTLMTDHLWFWEAEDDLLNALLLHTVILSTMMLTLPFITYKLHIAADRKLFRTKSFLEVPVRIYQACLLTFWFAFGFAKIWISQNNLRSDALHGVLLPLFFLPSMFYWLNVLHQLVIVAFLGFTQIKISNGIALLISVVFPAIYLTLMLPLLVFFFDRGFLLLDLVQILVASILSTIDSSVILCSFKKNVAGPINEIVSVQVVN